MMSKGLRSTMSIIDDWDQLQKTGSDVEDIIDKINTIGIKKYMSEPMPLDNSKEKDIMSDYDNVNKPKHYNREGAMECINEMEMIFGREAVKTFCKLNAWKYRYRAADKNGEEDLRKSDWYLRKYKELSDGNIYYSIKSPIIKDGNGDSSIRYLTVTNNEYQE